MMKLLKRILGHTLQAPMRLLTRMNVLGSKLLCDNKVCKDHGDTAKKKVVKKVTEKDKSQKKDKEK